MILDDLQITSRDGGLCEISARVRRGDDELPRLWYRFPERFAPDRPDGSPFLAGILLWAMRAGEDVEIDGPVSPALLGRIDKIMAVFRSMLPDQMRRISITAPAGEPPPPTGATACFFSRGIDSWYAVLTATEDDPQDPPLSHLVFSPDFLSTDWSEERVRSNTEQAVEAARGTGLEVVLAYTNQKRDFGGAQLMAMGLALGFSRMLVASGNMHGEIVPNVSHVVTNWRFSTERTEIVHYGDANRLDKTARVARSPLAMDTLAVCRLNRFRGERNCGRCEKCLQTMLELHVVGALGDGSRFAAPLEPRAVARMNKRVTNRHIWREVLYGLGDSPFDRQLAAAVRLVIAQSDLREAAAQLRSAAEDPTIDELRPGLQGAVARAEWTAVAAYRSLHPDHQPSPVERLRSRAATVITPLPAPPPVEVDS